MANKVCGCKEPCFKNGERAWGHMGGIMCFHLGERSDTGESQDCYSICEKNGERVDDYVNDTQYNEILKRKNS